ncbi:hypothetical protein BXY66_0440 [Shimia isoporae]|uniref:Uncharacterized protein n=1 Tax=Shimia isoporae TaxID=647720 RepID=A0A4R1NP56_9RHOB|nr:hypothetical protein [Shimia isoporae]TCL08403.1 hypothetical protein BXY66_0440 [Shimia isoporae]
MTTDDSSVAEILLGFETLTIDASCFHHREHVLAAFALLREYEFIDAAAKYAKGIRAIAERAGAHDKFNLTITYAFMSLIAERMAGFDGDFPAFVQAFPEVLDKNVLSGLYDGDRLGSELAKRVFLMPSAA